MAVSVSPRAGVGTRLKEARARRRVSIQDSSRVTRIKPRFLEALERDAPPSAFPAPVYARAFLREYAAYLGLDPEPLVEDYRAAHGDRETRPVALPQPVRPAPLLRRRSVQAGLALVGIGVVVWLAALVAGGGAPATAPPVRAPRTAAEPPPLPVVPPVEEVRLEIRVKDAPSWLRVGSGGETFAKGTKQPGWSRTFTHPERLRVTLGNAGAVRLFLDGERLGKPGGYGEVYRATFVRRDGQVEIELR